MTVLNQEAAAHGLGICMLAKHLGPESAKQTTTTMTKTSLRKPTFHTRVFRVQFLLSFQFKCPANVDSEAADDGPSSWERGS